MPYSPGDLRREVHALIADRLAKGDVVVRGWLVSDILTSHALPIIPDFEFNMMCRREMVGLAVREVLRELKAEDPEEVSGTGSLPLPGFKHLQLGYPFKLDDGQLVIKPLARMTPVEKLERADRYDRMAVGCQEHADELRQHAEIKPA